MFSYLVSSSINVSIFHVAGYFPDRPHILQVAVTEFAGFGCGASESPQSSYPKQLEERSEWLVTGTGNMAGECGGGEGHIKELCFRP